MSDIELTEMVNRASDLYKIVNSDAGRRALNRVIDDELAVNILVYLCSEYKYEASLHAYRLRENNGYLSSCYDDMKVFTNNSEVSGTTIKRKLDKLVSHNFIERDGRSLYKINADVIEGAVNSNL